MLPLLLLSLVPAAYGQYRGIHVGELAGGSVFVADASNVQALGIDLSALVSRGSLSFQTAEGEHHEPAAVYKISRGRNGRYYRFPVADLSTAGTGDYVFESAKKIAAGMSFGPHFGTGDDRLRLADAPQPLSLPIGLQGQWYESGWDRITVLNEKTLVLHGFSFMGTRPPDGWIFSGKAGVPVSKKFEGNDIAYVLFECKDRRCTPRDTYNRACALHDKDFHGDVQLIVELADGHTVHSIGWLAVYCYDVGVNFGSVEVQVDKEQLVPAFLPRVWNDREADESPCPGK